MANRFVKCLEQATDSTLVETNWDAIILCTDMIRSAEINAKIALAAIRKRLQHENPHVVNHTLLLLDACVKNCGSKMHIEVSTREFMEDFKNLVTDSKYEEVKNKALEMLQCWATAFANKPEYKMVVDTHNLMKLAGFDFPSMKEADAMFMAQVAPEWQEGNECYRCRSAFSIFTRKHHCRACGQIFCDKCSSREMALPQFGIDKEVRVCETCYENKQEKDKDAYFASRVGKTVKLSDLKKQRDASEAEKEKLLKEKEEEDLALAMAISQSEAEAKEHEKARGLISIYNGVVSQESGSNDDSTSVYKGVATTEPAESVSEDPLARYLNRDYWQQKKEGKIDEWAASATNPPINYGASAPPPSEPSVAPSICSTLMAQDETLNSDLAAMSIGGVVSNGDVQSDETMKWCQSIRDQVSVMDNRIRSNLARGRPVFNDSAIQDLFSRLTELHSHVLSRMHTLDEQRSYYEGLQDHLANIGEARQAINEMREEHERKKQEQMADEQRQRQAQMQQTLEMMRMKKHAMLMEQREQALQRFQQQQQEMAMRRQQQAYYNPQMGYAPQGTQSQPQQQHYYGYQPGQESSQQPGYTQNSVPQQSYYGAHGNGDANQLYYQQQQQQTHQNSAGQQYPPQYSASAPHPQSNQHYYDYQQQQAQYAQQGAYHQPQNQYQNGTDNQQYAPNHHHEMKQETHNNVYAPQQQQHQQQQGYGQSEPIQQHQQVAEQPLISFD